MITQEDIFEELLGDIQDEFDRLPKHVSPAGHQLVVGGGVTPPGGAQNVTSYWDADGYPEIWLDQIIAQDRAVDLPIVTHPVGGAKPPFFPGLPLNATLRICREVKNVDALANPDALEEYRDREELRT